MTMNYIKNKCRVNAFTRVFLLFCLNAAVMSCFVVFCLFKFGL